MAQRGNLLIDSEVDLHYVARDERQGRIGPNYRRTEQETRLREHGFAGIDGRLDRIEDLPRPGVVVIAAIEQCHERTGVDQESVHLP